MSKMKCPHCEKSLDVNQDILKQELNKKFEKSKSKQNDFYSGNETTNIYVDEETYKKLDQDAVEFGFVRTKKDGSITPNRNALISQIMMNYYNEFNSEEEQKKCIIQDTLKQNIPLLNTDSCMQITNYIMGSMDTLASEKIKNKKSIIKLKKTKTNQYIYDDIQYNNFYNDSISSISEYYYSMLKSYLKKPQYIREQILFKDKFNKLNNYIQKGYTIRIQYKSNPKYRNIYPYKIVHSVEENHNYLLAVFKSHCISYRIDYISDSIQISQDTIQITQEQKQTLDETIKYSPSSAQQAPGEHVVVALSKEGIQLLNRIYTFKPTSIEKIKEIDSYTIYKVYGSKFQTQNYFSRFGSDAIFLNEPELIQTQIDSANKILENYSKIQKELEKRVYE